MELFYAKKHARNNSGTFFGALLGCSKNCHKHLLESGITHIICVRQDIEAHFIRPQFTDTFTYLTLDIADSATENIIRFFPQVKKFIDGAIMNNQKVLVHGNNGTSRSATLVLAYIMEKFGLTSVDAFKMVKAKRFCIHPNVGFIAQLKEYEPIYKARRTLERGQTSCDNRKLKRKAEYLESSDYDLIQPPPSPVYFGNSENVEPNEFSNTVCRLLSQHRS
ncbi:hypothetical protein WA026_019209 [Henosepilachna vigintioctopunctata]|uniref:Serine/threonine/tyrosine-interacting protein n=1 Tax=Henosepilachna vigintioctopunctata TaxID=420089 RepID=A0AAW1V3T7_9CUCU